MKNLQCLLVVSGLTTRCMAQHYLPPPPLYLDPTKPAALPAGNDVLHRWWWGYRLEKVQDALRTERGWHIGPPKEDSRDALSMRVTAQRANNKSKANTVQLHFFFYHNNLIKRTYCFNSDHPAVQKWEAQLQAWPYDAPAKRWLDAEHHAQIQRQYAKHSVTYVVAYYERGE